MVILAVAAAVAYAVYLLERIPLDATPDLSDTQVIVYSRWDRSPDILEDQVTYPIVNALLGVPKVKAVRGFSDFGFSFVYVIFQDGTDIYWARSRVLEYLSKIQGSLPQGVKTEIGPDATGVGWVFQYALVDKSGKHDLAELRSYQDWVLRFALRSVARRRRRGVHRRLREAVPGHGRPGAAEGLQPLGPRDLGRDPKEQQRGGRAASGMERRRIHGAGRRATSRRRPTSRRSWSRPTREASPFSCGTWRRSTSARRSGGASRT